MGAAAPCPGLKKQRHLPCHNRFQSAKRQAAARKRKRKGTVDEAGEVEPVLVGVVLADGLGGLEEVLDLGHVQVRVAVVDELVEQLDAFPDAHLRPVQPPVLGPHPGHELVRLPDVVHPVELLHRLLPLRLRVVVPAGSSNIGGSHQFVLLFF